MSRLYYCILPVCAAIVIVFGAAPVAADHPGQSGPFPHITHLEVKGIVKKVEPSMFFVQPPQGLRPRTISISKAERMGLHDAQVGDALVLVVDEGNVLVDAHKPGTPGAGHRILTGTLNYADKYWEEIKVSTPEGVEQFAVDTMAGSKLSVFQEGATVTLELDEANVIIDIHRGQ
jgi:hypothetical protein